MTQHKQPVKNIIILGCGRSGTTLLASMFHKKNYTGTSMFVDPTHCPLIKKDIFNQPEVMTAFPNYSFEGYDGNSRGNFECKQVNYINELILSVYDNNGYSLSLGQRWIASIDSSIKIKGGSQSGFPEIDEAITFLVQHEPFCYKDPRLSYTLPVWQPYLDSLDVIYICVFRHPQATAKSLQRECQLPHMNISLTKSRCFELWHNIYAHILNNTSQKNCFFIHFDQILDYSGLSKLSKFCGISLDKYLVKPDEVRHNHYRGFDDTPEHVISMYETLCDRAYQYPFQGDKTV
ncbi:hypothetical protein QUF64_00155 [Anaerolineales bacterium HSG6]|nr:hypothetical protein [Anaerolineales bacterium HSG6]